MKKIFYQFGIFIMIISIIVGIATLSGCGKTGSSASDEPPLTISGEQSSLLTNEDDLITSDSTAEISFTGTSAEISGAGASVNGGTVSIASAGTYTISGAVSDGQVYVDAKDALVTLVLDNAEISCSYGPAIMIENAGKVEIMLSDNSENVISDSMTGGNEDTNACLFSRDGLELGGKGTLTVNGNYEHGIFSKDGLYIVSGTYIVNSVNDGIKGKDYLVIDDGYFTITSEGDCLRSNNDTDEGCGFITIRGGDYLLVSGGDGIQAESDLTISSGTFDITCGSGAGEFSVNTGDDKMNPFESTATDTDSTSCKGIKSSGGAITISGGSFVMNTEDDGIHANGDVTISSGIFTIASGDDGVHADESLIISDGDINITQSYEGLEGKSVSISGGNISILSSDDGINAAGGADSSGFGGFMHGQQDSFATSSEAEDMFILISGGNITVDAYGDGIDSNGSIFIEGGNIIVNGPTNSGNGAIDAGTESGGQVQISGGTILAIGAAGMDESFDSSSAQRTLHNWGQGSEGSEIVISDSKGNVILSYTATKAFGSIIFSSPELSADETYTVTVDGTVASEADNSMAWGFGGASGGKFGGGSRPYGTMPDGTSIPDSGTQGVTPPDPSGMQGTPPQGDLTAGDATQQA